MYENAEIVAVLDLGDVSTDVVNFKMSDINEDFFENVIVPELSKFEDCKNFMVVFKDTAPLFKLYNTKQNYKNFDALKTEFNEDCVSFSSYHVVFTSKVSIFNVLSQKFY